MTSDPLGDICLSNLVPIGRDERGRHSRLFFSVSVFQAFRSGGKPREGKLPEWRLIAPTLLRRAQNIFPSRDAHPLLPAV